MKKAGKYNAKFVPITNSELSKGEILLPGRHSCLCEAAKHGLINNCRNCGRIVCEQEGRGPCFTCGNLVCYPKEQELIAQQTKAGVKLYYKLMNQECTDSNQKTASKDLNLQAALEHRDKLLKCDRMVERRAKVIDDENDYFQIDSKWLSTKEREILNEKKDEFYDQLHNRQKTKLTFDFAGRKIIEEKPEIKFDVDELLNSDISIFENNNSLGLDMPTDFNPMYTEDKKTETSHYTSENLPERHVQIRIQDRELQEMSDEGMCLSLHQPYASLLVAGIKKHEGRVWYTSYRGRLWIHSANKEPTQKDIGDVEMIYKNIAEYCKFPESYPTGCLLGCVDLVDCLPQEEYIIKYPTGEIASPYVFICENALELTIKFPMKGKHKLYQLDSKIHQAAKKMVRKKM